MIRDLLESPGHIDFEVPKCGVLVALVCLAIGDAGSGIGMVDRELANMFQERGREGGFQPQDVGYSGAMRWRRGPRYSWTNGYGVTLQSV